ncbi:transglutaminase family protein [Aestuariivita sp.]|uniref:transglutaminase family protein n=1 Tax=Aestuariivita sp. TaxID=1872407 RepID=UPI00216C0CE1|nr:transglutaminase family protein [Aestuariivita sp.]MCE8007951.1 transglutaminase family protein [Aestuariivita sp.]
MTRITITHATIYRYRAPVKPGPHRLMLRPRETQDLALRSFDLQIAPTARIDWSHDVAGNAIAAASFDATTDTLLIRSVTTVDLTAPAWPVFPIAASAASYPFIYSDADWTDLGALSKPQYVDDAGRLSTWVEQFVMNRPTDTLSLLKDISTGIGAQIAYEIRDAEGTQGPLDTIDLGFGSCRDFAVLLADAVRTLGLGARLVSGYLYDPAGDQLGSAAAGSTHAWVEVYVPGAGWIPFDPTNMSMGSAHLIPVAVARDISQITPVIGSFQGENGDLIALDVTVRVEDERFRRE